MSICKTSILCVLVCLPTTLLADDGPSATDFIAQLGHRTYSVRRAATEELFNALVADHTAYPLVTAAIASPETSLEALSRLRNIRAAYFRYCFQRHYETTKYHVSEAWGGGKRLTPSYDLYLALPRQYIWSLPREHRFTDDQDIAAQCFTEGLAGLVSLEMIPEPEVLNADESMRYATHVWLWNWLESGRDPAVANTIMDKMLVDQDLEANEINRVAAEREWRGHIEFSTPPLPIEDRLSLLTNHTDIPIPQYVLNSAGAVVDRPEDEFDFNRFVYDTEKYVSGVLPAAG